MSTTGSIDAGLHFRAANRVRGAAEVIDADDVSALMRFAKRYSKGAEQTFPSEMVDRLLAGESGLRVWREHRGLTAAQLAAAVKITPAHVSKLESGNGNPSLAVLRRLAKVLDVELDLLVGRDRA